MDTPDPAAAVPDEPTAPVIQPPTNEPPTNQIPTHDGVHEPTAPIALGPVAGGWVPPGPPPPPAPPTMQPPAGAGGGTWGPISTPYGLAWGPPPIPPVPPAPPRRLPLMALGTVAVVVSLLVGVGVGYAVWRPAGTTTPSAANSGTAPGGPFTPPGSGSGPGTTPSGSGNATVPTGVAAKVDPGLVDINVTLTYAQESAAGTGQVLTSSGEVLTNNHVIDGATSISATDVGNGRTYTASVVGYDRTGDLAVIQLHGASGLSTVSTGDSSKVTVGEPVVAIGNAGGVGGTPSTASGTVTTLNQAITASDDNGDNSEQLTGLIEVNANVQPGDSGGPLVDSAGLVVGIDTAAAQATFSASSAADGYAIPINTALTVARQIEAGRSSSVVHIGPTAFLGVDIQGGGLETGAVVAGVAQGTPAQTAGLGIGDVITSLGGQPVTSPTSLSTIIGQHAPGDSVQLVWTDPAGLSHSAMVKLANGPAT